MLVLIQFSATNNYSAFTNSKYLLLKIETSAIRAINQSMNVNTSATEAGTCLIRIDKFDRGMVTSTEAFRVEGYFPISCYIGAGARSTY